MQYFYTVTFFQDESHVNLSLNPSPSRHIEVPMAKGPLFGKARDFDTPAYYEQNLLPSPPHSGPFWREGLGVRSEDVKL
jgi:hypothetical protein